MWSSISDSRRVTARRSPRRDRRLWQARSPLKVPRPHPNRRDCRPLRRIPPEQRTDTEASSLLPSLRPRRRRRTTESVRNLSLRFHLNVLCFPLQGNRATCSFKPAHSEADRPAGIFLPQDAVRVARGRFARGDVFAGELFCTNCPSPPRSG